MIGRKQVDSVVYTVSTVANSTLYSITVNGNLVSFTSASSGATAVNIVAGLATAFSGASITGVTFTDHTDGTFTLAVSSSGTAWSNTHTPNISYTSAVSPENWVAAFNAVKAVNNTWIGLVATTHTPSDVEALAAAVEADGNKVYATSSQDTTAGTSTTTDIGAVLKAAAYTLTTTMWYSQADTVWPEAAYIAYNLQFIAGSNTWANKTLTGVPVDTISDTATTYLVQKNYVTYENIGGVNVTTGGKVASGEYVDVMILVLWTRSNMQSAIWQALVNLPKVPYTAAGFAIVQSKMMGVLKQGVKNGGFSATPAPTVSVPNISDISPTDIANRALTNVTFYATLASAVQSVAIQGTVVLPQ